MHAVCCDCSKEGARSVNWDHSCLLFFSFWAHMSRQLCCRSSLCVLSWFFSKDISWNYCEKAREEVLKCQLSGHNFVVWFFIFKRERKRENTWITLGFLQGRRRDYRKKCLKSKSVALKYAAALKCVPEYFKATSNIFINKFVIGLWIGNILCTNKKELFWTHSVFSLVFMDYSVPWL